MYFADMAQALGSAKLSYACSASFLEDFKITTLTAEQQAFMAGIEDPLFAETVKDFLRNTQFRRDYWIKGARSISTFEQAQYWAGLRFVLIRPRNTVTLKLSGTAGTVDLLGNIYDPILDLMADHKVHAMPEIQLQAERHHIPSALLFEALALLMARGDIAIAQDEDTIQKQQSHCDSLNAHIMRMAMVNDDVPWLVSPVTGGAFMTPRISLLFLHAYAQGGSHTPQAYAKSAWQALKEQGQKLIRDGKTLQDEDENIAELVRLAKEFAEGSLPVLKALRIATTQV